VGRSRGLLRRAYARRAYARRAYARRGESKKTKRVGRLTDDKQSISFLPSYSPRQPPQLGELVRNIQLILLSISLPSQSNVLDLLASDTHPHAWKSGRYGEIVGFLVVREGHTDHDWSS